MVLETMSNQAPLYKHIRNGEIPELSGGHYEALYTWGTVPLIARPEKFQGSILLEKFPLPQRN